MTCGARRCDRGAWLGMRTIWICCVPISGVIARVRRRRRRRLRRLRRSRSRRGGRVAGRACGRTWRRRRRRRSRGAGETMIARSLQHRSRRSRHRPRPSRHPRRRRRSPCPASFAARSPAIRSPRPRTGPIEGSTARARDPPRRRPPGFGSGATCAPPGDARRCPTRPSATPGPGAGRRPSRRESAPPVSSSWTTSRVGRGLPPRCHFVCNEKSILCTARALTFPSSALKRQTQQQPRATVGCPNRKRPRRRIESVVGLFTQGQLPIGN